MNTLARSLARRMPGRSWSPSFILFRMQIRPANRRDLVTAYVVIAVGAWMIAFGLAHVAHVAQHAWMSEHYLLLPINLVSFYFLPLLAIGLLSLVIAVSGWSRSAIDATDTESLHGPSASAGWQA